MIQIDGIIRAIIAGVVLIFSVKGVLWYLKLQREKRVNALESIDLAALKINLNNQSKPIDKLVSDSNKSHAATDEVVNGTRNDDTQGE